MDITESELAPETWPAGHWPVPDGAAAIERRTAMKGWRTLAINAGIAAGTALLQWAAGVNWVDYVGEVYAVLIVALVNGGLRLMTTTPVGKAE